VMNSRRLILGTPLLVFPHSQPATGGTGKSLGPS
jgi:hypothetical protein